MSDLRHFRETTARQNVPGGKKPRRYPSSAAPRQFFVLWGTLFALAVAAAYALGIAPRGASELVDRLVLPIAGFVRIERAPIPSGAALAVERENGSRDSAPRIIINPIGIAAPIVFPANADLATLNAALTTGVVHYPGSVLPGAQGNVFLFGHSTGLPAVRNQAFAVFNRLKELAPGDTIRIQYGGREYWYETRSVAVRKAADALVDLRPNDKRLLTLSTCRIFGGLDDRYVVEAELVKSYPVRNPPSASDTSP